MVTEFIIAVFTAGAAWGGSQMALNGTRKRVIELKDEFARHVQDDKDSNLQNTDRLARIETKIDVLMEKK